MEIKKGGVISDPPPSLSCYPLQTFEGVMSLKAGGNILKGKVSYDAIAQFHKLEFVPLQKVQSSAINPTRSVRQNTASIPQFEHDE